MEIKNLNIFGKNKKVFFKKGIENQPTIVMFHGFPDNFKIWKNISNEIDSKYSQLGINLSDLSLEIDESNLIFLTMLKKLNISIENGLYFIGHDIGGPVMTYLSDALKADLKGHVFVNSVDLTTYKKNIRSTQILKSWYGILFQLSPYRWVIKNNLLFSKKIFRNFASDHPGEIFFESIDFYKNFFQSILGLKATPKLVAPVYYILSKDDPYLKIPKKRDLLGDISVIRGGHWDVFKIDSIAGAMINKKLNEWESDHA